MKVRFLLEWYGRVRFGPSEKHVYKDDVLEVDEPIAGQLIEYGIAEVIE